MKTYKILFTIIAALFVGGLSHVKATPRIAVKAEHQDYRGAEIAFVKEGKLYFYFPQSKEIKRLEEETESVFNCVFNNTTDLIYYTVERENDLWLKKASYHDDSPVEITEIGSLKVKKERCITDTYGEKAPLIFDRSKSILLPYNFKWDLFDFTKAMVYSTLSVDDKIEEKDFSYEKKKEFWNFEEDIEHKVINEQLIYKGRNLSDGFDWELEEGMDIKFTDFKFSKDGSKLLFSTFLGMGDLAHGPYCVADVDGSHQQILMEDGLSSEYKPFWVGNQVVFLRYMKETEEKEEENPMITQQLCITDATDNSISVIDENVDYFAARELQKSKQEGTIQAKNISLDNQEIIKLVKPPFRATFAENNRPISRLSLKQISVEGNNITDENDWFLNNELSMPRMNTSAIVSYSHAEAPLELPENIPQQWGELRLITAFSGANANFYLYGKSPIDYQHLLITDAENTRILHLFDFENYIYNNKEANYINIRVDWADIIDNILYVSTSHSTYAESSDGINAFITAIDLSNNQLLWQSDALVSNAVNFEMIDDHIVCGYGFTAEPDYLYVLNRFTGKKTQTLKLATGPSYIIKKDDKVYVRTYNKNYVFEIKRGE